MFGFEELAQAVRNNNDEALPVDVTEAMATNESFIFRDQRLFDRLQIMQGRRGVCSLAAPDAERAKAAS